MVLLAGLYCIRRYELRNILNVIKLIIHERVYNILRDKNHVVLNGYKIENFL